MADLFKEKAEDWDANDRRTSLAAAISGSILEHIPLHEQMTVMDFGAGTGLISSAVAPKVNRITAVDTSQSMLEKLADKPELQGKVEINCRNILEAPLDIRFDLIMSAMTLHHVEDTSRLLASFGRHLNDSGMIALADLDSEDGSFHPADTEGVFHFGFDRDDLCKILEANGFADIEFCTAHTLEGDTKDYPIFLVTARKA